MKLLLTSSGITNNGIARSLRQLLGKPFKKSKLVFIPTAANIKPRGKEWLIRDLENCRKLGFKEIDILNIDATPQKKAWWPRVSNADVILFGGGDTSYLMEWIKKSGFARALSKLLKSKVYVGISAGSIAATPDLSLTGSKDRKGFRIDEKKVISKVGKGLGLVNFYVRPHLNSPHFPNSKAKPLRRVAQKLKMPLYAVDDNSAVEVVGKSIKVVGTGKFLAFNTDAGNKS